MSNIQQKFWRLGTSITNLKRPVRKGASSENSFKGLDWGRGWESLLLTQRLKKKVIFQVRIILEPQHFETSLIVRCFHVLKREFHWENKRYSRTS